MEPNRISPIKALSQFALISAVIFLLFYFSAKITGNQNQNNNLNTPVVNPDPSNVNVTIDPVETDLDKFNALVQKGSYVDILERKGQIISPEFTAHDQKKNNEIANQFIAKNSIGLISTGKISSGYLYIKAGAGNPIGLLLPGESVYTYLLNTPNGGHLYKPHSLVKVPTQDGYTQYLFKLDNISLTGLPYDDGNKPRKASWLSVLKNPGTYPIGTFVSSSRFSKVIEVRIAYEGELGALTIR